ncbi:MAG: membrane protein insertase YidC [Pseudomonadota bacterium]
MDNQRLFTWGLFGLMLFICWQAWEADYGPRPVPASPANGNGDTVQTDASIPTVDADIPQVDTPTPDGAVPQLSAPAPAADTGPVVRVSTDVLDVTISLAGADINGAVLKAYPVAKNRPDDLVTLLDPASDPYGRFETGLLIPGQSEQSPSHVAPFKSTSSRFELRDGAESLNVPLSWTRDDGITVTKTFTFYRDSYRVDLAYAIDNASAESTTFVPYGRIRRQAIVPERSMFDVQSYSFTGPVTSDGAAYDKHEIDDLADGDRESFATEGGWIAAIQYHFALALVPQPQGTWEYEVSGNNRNFLVSALGQDAAVTAPSGGSADLTMTLFVGPKLQSQLGAIAPKLPKIVDYGVLTLLSAPLFDVLQFVHNGVANWGWAIILVTVLIKIVFYPLTAASGRSMAKMRELQPRLKKLQERYAEDRQALSREMMALYKREKINPAAGCLPLLIQMPFFLAFYWVLLESVEMRQAPFMLWIDDLSSRDPYFVLPLLMGASMFFQQKLNPAPADPVQARVMSILPIVFTAFFAFFPAGLVLYWFTNTLLSIAQQWRINTVVAKEQASKS